MRVTITYKVDKITIENAVRNCIYNGISPISIKNIKKCIKEYVTEHGMSAVKFPEHWFIEDEEIKFFSQSKINEIVEKLYTQIK